MKTHEKIIIGAYSIILVISLIFGSIWWYKYTSTKSEYDKLGRLSEQYREQLATAESALEAARADNREAAEITGKLTELNGGIIQNVSDAKRAFKEIEYQVGLLEKVYSDSNSN